MHNNNGFTMIELLSIIVVLAVIMVIAIPKFFESMDASKEKDRERIYETIENAAKVYRVNNNIPVGQPILLSTLCEEKYFECPLTDPVTGLKMDGQVNSSTDVNYNNVIIYEYVE